MIAAAPVAVGTEERLAAMEERIEALGETQATIEERLSEAEALAEHLTRAYATRGEYLDVIGQHQNEIWSQIKWFHDAISELASLIADLVKGDD